MNAVDLHCHSTFSLLDGLGTPAQVVQRAKDLGWSSAALTELPERISCKIEIDKNGCWLWQGWKEKRAPRKLSYGKVWWDGSMRYAHRVIYTILVGEIPEGKQLDHLCRVVHCVNPGHLEPVDCKTNIRRGETGKNMTDKISCFCGKCKTCKSREYMRRHRAKRA